MRLIIARFIHNIGLCAKARMGYRCYGSNDYKECGGVRLLSYRNAEAQRKARSAAFDDGWAARCENCNCQACRKWLSKHRPDQLPSSNVQQQVQK